MSLGNQQTSIAGTKKAGGTSPRLQVLVRSPSEPSASSDAHPNARCAVRATR